MLGVVLALSVSIAPLLAATVANAQEEKKTVTITQDGAKILLKLDLERDLAAVLKQPLEDITTELERMRKIAAAQSGELATLREQLESQPQGDGLVVTLGSIAGLTLPLDLAEVGLNEQHVDHIALIALILLASIFIWLANKRRAKAADERFAEMGRTINRMELRKRGTEQALPLGGIVPEDHMTFDSSEAELDSTATSARSSKKTSTNFVAGGAQEPVTPAAGRGAFNGGSAAEFAQSLRAPPRQKAAQATTRNGGTNSAVAAEVSATEAVAEPDDENPSSEVDPQARGPTSEAPEKPSRQEVVALPPEPSFERSLQECYDLAVAKLRRSVAGIREAIRNYREEGPRNEAARSALRADTLLKQGSIRQQRIDVKELAAALVRDMELRGEEPDLELLAYANEDVLAKPLPELVLAERLCAGGTEEEASEEAQLPTLSVVQDGENKGASTA